MNTLHLKTLFAFLFCTLFINTNLFSQEKCATQKIHETKFATDENYRNAYLDAQRANDQNVKPYEAKAGGTVYKIPVVVHVIHLGEAVGIGTNISEEQILSCITSLNDAYRKKSGTSGFGNGVDTEIQFCLAQKDPSGNPTNGIKRVNGSGVSDYSTSGLTSEGASPNEVAVKALSKWDNTKYYNLWVVSEIDGNDAGAGTQGFAYYPGAGPTIDGAVMLYNAFGYDPDGTMGYNLKPYTNRNRTLIHEIGHGLNLAHTFQGDDANSDGVADQCPANTTCATQGDKVCDTPPHQRSESDCTGGTNSCDGNSSRELFIHNYMDYSSDACQNMFTAGQAARMSAVIMAGGTRQNLSSSINIDNCGCNVPVPRFYATSTTPCLGMPVQFIDESLNFPTSWTWSFAGGTPATSTSQNPSVTYATTGTFNVSLTAISSTGVSTTTTKIAYINPVGSQAAPFLENFEGTFPPSGWSSVSGDAAIAWGTEGTKAFEKRSAAGNAGSTIGSVGLNCYQYNKPGKLDALISPPISLSSLSVASLTYKTAYRYYGNPSYSDTLSVYVSIDCGNSFAKIQKLGGSQLSAVTSGSDFTPSVAGDWILRTVDLTSYIGGNIILKFEVKNGWGNNVYFDDVNVTGTGASNTITTSAIAGSPFCAGATGISVPYTISGTYNAGNVFVAQLSNSSGSFASPTSLGSLTSTAAGTISTSVALPSVAGTNYRIRVVSTNPSVTGAENGSNLTINTLSTAPTGISGTTTICAGGTTTLTLSGGSAGTAATAKWYTASCGGTLVGTGNSLVVSPASTTTYYVRYEGTCNNTACASTLVTVNTLSTAPTGISGTTTICAGGTTTLTLSGGSAGTAATAKWYTASCGGTLVGTGNSLVVSPASTTTYYVRYEGTCNNTACASTSVTVNTTVSPIVSINASATTICSGLTTTFTASPTEGGTTPSYEWKVNGATTGINAATLISTFNNNDLVSCVMTSNSACASPLTATSNVVTMTVNSSTINISQQPTSASVCFNSTANYVLTATGVNNYKWQVSSGGAFTDLNDAGIYSGTTTASLTIASVTGLNNYQYRCNLTDNCGTMVSSAASLIVDPGTIYYQDFDNDGFGNPTMVTTSCSAPIGYVANNTDCDDTDNAVGDGPCGPVGPTTQLAPVSCGAVDLVMNSFLYCVVVPGAQDYEYEITNTALNYSFVARRGASNPNINLFRLGNLAFNTTYDVRMKVKVAGVWGEYGNSCQITTAAPISTQLALASCDATDLSLTSYLYCNAINGAQDYEYEVTNVALNFINTARRGASNPNILLNKISGVTYATTYQVRVKAKVGDVWGDYGATCSITTAAWPTTQLSTTSCNATGLLLNSTLYCNTVAGASDYEYEISNTSLNYTRAVKRGVSNPNIGLVKFSGLVAGQTYNVTVKAKVGTVWSNAGPVCNITMAETLQRIAFAENETPTKTTARFNDLNINVYPNPVSKLSTINITFNENEIGKVLLTDITGRVVAEQNFNSDLQNNLELNLAEIKLQTGIYHLSIIGTKTTTNKSIVVIE